MARPINLLSARKVATLTKPGRHADGGNLYLRVSESGSKTWCFLYQWQGKATELGFGSARDVTLQRARELAAEARAKIASGENPKHARQSAADCTFKACAERLIAAMRPSWRGQGVAREWERSLLEDAKPLSAMPVDQIKTADILAVLQKHWQTKPETAMRMRARIERVIDRAKVEGFWPEDKANPARWRGHLDQALSKRRHIDRNHHAAMPYEAVPAFLAKLREKESITSLALEFIVLTAARTSEGTGARWDEIDRDKGVWTIPKERMKAGREHRVPLSSRALAILDTLYSIRHSDFVFPSSTSRLPGIDRLRASGVGRPITGPAMKMLLRRMEVEEATTHGFRSAFRDWAAETTPFPSEVCEMALAHVVGNKTEAAYRRGDLFEKRRQLMDAWASFCKPGERGTVVAFQRYQVGVPE